MHRTFIIPAVLAVTLLGACVERGDLVGAGIGAGLGCAAGEVLSNGKCVEGAIIGGVAGVVGNRIR